MPTYCYRSDDGEPVEITMTVSEMLAREEAGRIRHGGRFLTRDIAAEHAGPRDSSAGWPMKSDAAGVHPDQAELFTKDSQKRGVPTEFDKKTGQAIFTSSTHRKRYCESVGLYDKNGSYGDPKRK